jgi:hypothetical protein
VDESRSSTVQFSLLGETKKYILLTTPGVLDIPSRFLVGRNESSCKITGDHDFALNYYVR